MRRFFKNLFLLSFAVMLVTAVCCVTAFAQGHCEMQISPKNAGVGEKINVTIEFSSDNMDIQDVKANLEYDPTIIEIAPESQTQGADGIVVLNGFAGDAPVVKFDLVFEAKKVGTTKIAVTNSSANNTLNESLGSPVDEDTITVGEESGLEAESKLKELTVSTGQLSPSFSADVTSYVVNVENDVTEIEISAQMSSVKSSIYFSGQFDDIAGIDGTSPKVYVGKLSLAEGDNQRKITITAENGEETVYTINVVRLAEDEIVPIVPDEPADSETPDEEEESDENINIFQSSTVTSASGKTPKNPNDDNVIEKIFPIIIITIFVAAVVLFVIVSFAKIQSEKSKKSRRRRSSSSSSRQPSQSRSSTSSSGQKKVQATVRKRKSSNSNVRRPK